MIWPDRLTMVLVTYGSQHSSASDRRSQPTFKHVLLETPTSLIKHQWRPTRYTENRSESSVGVQTDRRDVTARKTPSAPCVSPRRPRDAAAWHRRSARGFDHSEGTARRVTAVRRNDTCVRCRWQFPSCTLRAERYWSLLVVTERYANWWINVTQFITRTISVVFVALGENNVTFDKLAGNWEQRLNLPISDLFVICRSTCAPKSFTLYFFN